MHHTVLFTTVRVLTFFRQYTAVTAAGSSVWWKEDFLFIMREEVVIRTFDWKGTSFLIYQRKSKTTLQLTI